MSKVNSEVVIENENLFRVIFCAPAAILFSILAANSISSSGIVIFQIIFVLMAMYFSLCTLGYAAFYSNEVSEGLVERFIKNENLSTLLNNAPLAVVFVAISAYSLSSMHVFFSVIFVSMASYFSLRALASAAFYTNDCYAEHD